MPKVNRGFFLRAESLFNFASYIDEVDREAGLPRNSLHDRSHGEAFLTLFQKRFNRGLFILDEPEAALSPQRQLAFLRILHELTTQGQAQFLIATHSPLIIAFPGARVLRLSKAGFEPIRYQDSEQFQLTKSFLDSPDRFLQHLLGPENP